MISLDEDAGVAADTAQYSYVDIPASIADRCASHTQE